MDEIDVFFTQKLYYSKKDIKNDFFITITNGKNLDPQPEKEKNKEDNDKKPTISILGLEKLFKKDSIDKLMDEFTEALGKGVSNWTISYEESQNYQKKCLIIKSNTDEFFTISFSINNYEFTALSTSGFIDDPETIGLTVYFDNFDTIYPNLANHIKKVDSIKIFEIPYINQFDVLSNDGKKKITAAVKGSEVIFNWEVGPAEETVEVSLTDEKGTVIKNASAIIDEDKKFTLSLKKDGYEVSKTIDIKAVYIDELALHDFEDHPAMAIHKGDKARIIWSVKNASSASVHLRDELGTEITESPYIVKIDNDKTFTLEIELNGEMESRKLDVHKTLWKKEIGSVNLPFRPDEKCNNKITFIPNNNSQDDYYFFRHPKLYHSSNLTSWEKIADYPTPPNNFICYSYYFQKISIDSNTLRGITTYYTSKDTSIEGFSSHFYNLDTHQWDYPAHFLPQNCQNNELLFYHTQNQSALNSETNYEILFEIHEHSIYFALIWFRGPDTFEELLTLSDKKIISIDTLIDSNNQMYLAILCDNNDKKHTQSVLVYSLQIQVQANSHAFTCRNIITIELDRNDQKKIFLAQANSKYIVLDNYVFDLNYNENLSETHFSPIETIPKGEPKVMIFCQKDTSTFSAIVEDGDKATLWTYEP